MEHINKDILISLYYQEASEQDEQQARAHLAVCDKCRDYLNLLQQMDATLDHWQDEKPKPGTVDLILENIPTEKVKVVDFRPSISPVPIFRIAFSLLFILLFIYFVHSKIVLLPFWADLEQLWVVEAFGSFGFAILIFLCAGAFISLSLAPMLYFNLHKKAIFIR